MSFKFGPTSQKRLWSCEPALQAIAEELIKVMDVTIVCGYRSEEEQNAAFSSGNSKAQFPSSKHNIKPSRAVDIAPCVNGVIDWNDIAAFDRMAGIIEGIAHMKGIKIRLGRDFKNLTDRPHLELAD